MTKCDADYKHYVEEIQREIDATDHKLNQHVYELYGLTKSEIDILEQATQEGP